MRPKRALLWLPHIVFAAGLHSAPLGAPANRFWNAGGDGNWGSSPGDKNWNLIPGAPSGNTAWPDSSEDIAVFQDTAGGVVTVFTPVQALGIVQDGADYMINASSITLVESAGIDPFIEVRTGRLAVDSVLDGNAGMVKTGDGDLLLSNGNIYSGGTVVSAGTLTLGGSLASPSVTIATGATLRDLAGGLADPTNLVNAGTLVLNSAETVASYRQKEVGGFSGSGGLTVTHGAVLHGGTVFGTLIGEVTTTGDVQVTGTLDGNSLSVTGGTLNLNGISTAPEVNVAGAGTLNVINGGLSPAATLNQRGTLLLSADQRITSYLSNGGTLAVGPGVLATTNSVLNDESLIAGTLTASSLTSNGKVTILGSATAAIIQIRGGTLINAGTLGSPSSVLDIASGATLVAGGSQRYALLTTSGAGEGRWLGNLSNTSAVAPGDRGGFGTLAIQGDFHQSESAVLAIDVSRTGHDLVAVSGTAAFGGTLELNQLGEVPEPFVPIQVVDAAMYSGTISDLVSNLNGAVWFNPGSGEVTLIPQQPDETLAGASANERAVWVSLYDDVIDPGVANISAGQVITGGIADARNPDLTWALAASVTPAGLNGALLDHLSPEVYAAFADYAMLATRTHQRDALSAPVLWAAGSGTDAGRAKDSKGGMAGDAKDAAPVSPAIRGWEVFAAADAFHLETDSSANQADYDLSGGGLLLGVRTRLEDRFQFASYVGADWGTIDGSLIEADGVGWSAGLIVEAMLSESTQTRLTAALSHGRYTFEGSRDSVSATLAGWTSAKVDIPDVDSSATELFLGVEGIAWRNRHLRVIPSAGIRYESASMDGFRESTGSQPGAPIALEVGQDHQDSFLGEMAVTTELELNDKLMAWGRIGINADLMNDTHELRASFAKGNRPFHVTTQGMDEDLMFVSLGAVHRVTDSISIGVGWRTEIRSDSDASYGFNLSSSFRF